jgi:hypothetical protein
MAVFEFKVSICDGRHLDVQGTESHELVLEHLGLRLLCPTFNVCMCVCVCVLFVHSKFLSLSLSLCRARGFVWRIHCGVEVTESSTYASSY